MKSRKGIPELPILSTDDTTNFSEFQKSLANYGLREYGNLGHLIESNEYWEPPPIDIPNNDIFSLEEDPHGFIKSDFLERIKSRRRQIEDMKAKRASFYAVLFGQLSPESEEKVKLCATFPIAESMKDPLELWKCIRETHISAQTGINIRDRMKVRDAYANLRQGPTEALITYKERFNNTLEAMKAVGQKAPRQSDQAVDFVNRLDDERYGDFKALLENHQIFNVGQFPKTVNDAYTFVSKYRNSKPKAQDPGTLAPAAAPASVFITKMSKKKTENKNSENSYKSKNKLRKQKKEESESEEDSEETKHFPCPICQEDHPAFRCTYLSECRKLVASSPKSKQESALLALLDGNDFEHDDVVL